MDRGPTPHLSWMLLPVSAVLVLAALSLSHQPYTGAVLRGDWVAAVDAGSPAERAGLSRGDRVLPWRATGVALGQNPLARAAPGQPILLLRERDGALAEVRLVPDALPDGERRIMAALLAVACGFVVLGGWVWSERRDPLTRAFLLLCLAFAWLLAPYPRWQSLTLGMLYDALYSGVSVFLPALAIHFFGLFPESERPSGRLASATRIGYGVATVLFAAAVVPQLLPGLGEARLQAALALVQGIAGLWFALGMLVALGLFARSYRRARNPDSRRRLRVALVGAVLGVGPLAALVALRNLFPGAPFPAERWAVVLTLLVPASFAWATVVHRIFEFRVALRAAAIVVVLAVAGIATFLLGEWLASAWRQDLGAGIAGGALAFGAILAAVAGPAGAWLRVVGDRLVPEGRERTLTEWLARNPASRRGNGDQIVEAACEAVCASLKLDGCLALQRDAADVRVAAHCGAMTAPEVGASFGVELVPGVVQAVDRAAIAHADAIALEAAGVRWLLPLGGAPSAHARSPEAFLLLGRRLSGSWLGVHDIEDLERLAAHLEVLLENARLREAATAHGERDRELSRAGAIQAHLRPRRIPAFRSLDCAAGALSCEPVGGDYYDFVRGRGRTFTLAVGDAAGKGVPAALIGVWAQASFRTRARDGSPPGEVLSALNRELVAMDQPQAFVALLCARVEAQTGRLWFANAGLTPPILRRRDGAWEELTSGGVLLGVTPTATYSDVCVDLEPGDIIALYTDGLTEARRGDELFGTRRVAAVIEAHAHRGAADILRALMAQAQAFADHPVDDMTVVVLKQLARPVRGSRQTLQNALKWGRAAADAAR